MSDKETEALPVSQQRLLALSRWENEGGAVLVASEVASSVKNEELAAHHATNADKIVTFNRA